MVSQVRGRWLLSTALSLTLVGILLGALSLDATAACDYYASPTGIGNGLTQSSPFKISSFWSAAAPGKTLCLLDGEYIGSESMISPPQGLKGNASSPITVRALNDGKATMNGQSSRIPVQLNYNDYFVLEGFNAHHSSSSVVSVMYSNYNIIRRVAAWDAADGNYKIFSVDYGNYNLIEDCAGWGIARKVFSSSQDGNYTTFRRNWGRWEGSHFMGPKMTYTLAYNHYNMIIENSIGTWSGEKMKQSYALQCDPSSSYSMCGQTFTNYDVDQPFGIFSTDRLDGSKEANSRILGSIAYLKTDKFQAASLFMVTKLDSYEIVDSVGYVPSTVTSKKPFGLSNLQTAVAANLKIKNSSGVSGTTSAVASEWQVTNLREGNSPSTAFPSGQSLFTSGTSKGASICKCYENGVLTNVPLWPWPMNQRIIDATIASGRDAVDVTATIEQMFGPIPSECKKTSQNPPPVNLTISSIQ